MTAVCVFELAIVVYFMFMHLIQSYVFFVYFYKYHSGSKEDMNFDFVVFITKNIQNVDQIKHWIYMKCVCVFF